MSRRPRNLDADVDETPTRHARTYANGHSHSHADNTDMADMGDSARGEGYGNMHRAFLQAFLARSVMRAEEVRSVLAAVMSVDDPTRPTLPNDITAPLLTQTLQTLNARLAPLDYEIRSTRDQQSSPPSSTSSSLSAPANDHVYALVNTASDALTQLATGFSAEEIAFVKRVLDAMFDGSVRRGKEVMAVESMEARRLAKVRSAGRASQAHLNGGTQVDAEGDVDAAAPALKGIDIAAAETVLGTLVDQGFFRRQKVGGVVWFSLAPRGIMELRGYLKEMYNDPPPEEGEEEEEDERVIRIRDCEGCREIVTWGVRCTRRSCGVRFHDGCAWPYFGRRGGGNGSVGKCPACRAEWTGDCYVGPRAAVGAAGRASAGGAGRVSVVSNGRVSNGGGGRRDFADMGDEEDEDDGY